MSNLVAAGQVIKDIELCIFDKDGTLIDVHYYWYSMIKYRTEYIVESIECKDKDNFKNVLMDAMGINLDTNKIKKEGPVGIKPRAYIVNVVYLKIREYDYLVTKEFVTEAFDYIDKYSIKKISDIVIALPGAKKIIDSLKRNRVQVAIATTDLTERAKLALDTLGLLEKIDLIVGNDLVSNPKPKPDLVNYISNKLKIDLNKIVMFGDSLPDLDMAINANVKFIGLKTGLYDEEFLRRADTCLENLEYISLDSGLTS